MKEHDLIDLGFKRIDVTKEESGYPNDWYYYIYKFAHHLELISSDNEEAEKYGWFVEFFDIDGIRFTSRIQLLDLISLIENAKQ